MEKKNEKNLQRRMILRKKAKIFIKNARIKSWKNQIESNAKNNG